MHTPLGEPGLVAVSPSPSGGAGVGASYPGTPRTCAQPPAFIQGVLCMKTHFDSALRLSGAAFSSFSPDWRHVSDSFPLWGKVGMGAGSAGILPASGRERRWPPPPPSRGGGSKDGGLRHVPNQAFFLLMDAVGVRGRLGELPAFRTRVPTPSCQRKSDECPQRPILQRMCACRRPSGEGANLAVKITCAHGGGSV